MAHSLCTTLKQQLQHQQQELQHRPLRAQYDGTVVARALPIGNSLSKGISGGQAKRVNIGIALITNPRVLFLVRPCQQWLCSSVLLPRGSV